MSKNNDKMLRFRAINPDGSFNLRARGQGFHPLKDMYHMLLTSSWPQFLLVIVFAWAGLNVLFTGLYLAGGDCVAGAEPGDLTDHFFFSVQTLSTIGYGTMSPTTMYAHVIVAIEAFTGLLSVALMTGLMFAKFSRPTARILFTDQAVIAERDGKKSFMIRVGNARANMIVDAHAKLYMVYSEMTPEGEPVRRFLNLDITRPDTALFALTWTIIHPINEDSPLNQCSTESLRRMSAEIICVVSGLDQTIAQPITARRSYLPEEITFDHRFKDMLIADDDGGVTVDFRHFHDIVPNVSSSSE